MDIDWERAVTDGNLPTVLARLQHGADVNARDRHGQTALMLASHRGHADVVTALITHGADLNVTAKYGLSALMLAVISGHGDIARQLVRAGADRSLKGAGAPGFHGRTAAELAMDRRLAADILAELKPPS